MSEFIFVEDKNGNSEVLKTESIAVGGLILNFFSAIESEYIIPQNHKESSSSNFYEWFKSYEDAIELNLIEITTNIEFVSKLEDSLPLEDQYQLIKSMNPSLSLSFEEYQKRSMRRGREWISSNFLQKFLRQSIKYFKRPSIEQTYFFDQHFTTVEFEHLSDLIQLFERKNNKTDLPLKLYFE